MRSDRIMAAPSTTPVDLPVMPSRLHQGQRVGRHVIDGWVRDGGMAVVYRGHHVDTGAKVAIKVIAERYARDPVLTARFEREGQVMGRLASVPGVVRVHDVGTLADGRRYLVMEWIEGEDLDDLLDHLRNQDERMEIARACRLVRDVARGIAGAHARQVVHRDLKPSNVMLDRREGVERAKVVDFGVSADLGARERGEDLTTTGMALGTSGYMAPEQALGLHADPAFDVWALGVLCFELLTGDHVPPGVDAQRLHDVAERRSGVPESVAKLIRGCLAMDMRQRPTAAEVAARLDAVLGQLAVAGLRDAPGDDRPEKAAGAIEGTDPRQPRVRRGDASALGLEAPPRITPVRVAAKAKPGAAGAVTKGVAGAEDRRARRVGIVLSVVALGLALSIAGAMALWPGADDGRAVEASVKPDRSPVIAKEPEVAPVEAEAEAEDAAAAIEPEVDAEGAGVAVEPGEPAAESEAKAVPPERESSEGGGRPAKDPGPRKSAPEASGPAHETPRCEDLRSAADAAKASRNWSAVLSRTRDASCWASKSERTLLRVTALAELGRWEECVRAGSGSADPRIATRTKFCRKQQEAG
jgi:serine/threonine-protein kinase